MGNPIRRLTDAAVGLGVLAVLASVAMPMVAADRDRSRRGKDAGQLREIHRALTTWAGAHNGAFPLPSAIDTANKTVVAAPNAQRNKNNTGNIFSLLIFNGLMTPQVMVSPVETNGAITPDSGYQYASPTLAAVPAEALWDPGLAGTPIDIARRSSGVGNCSYAHVMPVGQREALWTTATGPGSVLMANRGPRYEGTNASDESPYSGPQGFLIASGGVGGLNSNTLRFYSPTDSWIGNVLKADGSVVLAQRAEGAGVRYQRTPTLQSLPDNIFVNESDDATSFNGFGPGRGTNAYLRLVSSITGTDTNSTLVIFKD